jgi:predicted DNA-binding transcriptional regulator YafY
MGNKERRGNRTDRLFATILLLQNRPNMTSRDLSEHFGVSRRTIFRDLSALAESGVPLTYSETGGYEILEGYQLPPLMLSAREAATLLVGTEFMKLQADASLRQDSDAVALKIRTVLPREIGEYVDRLRENTVLDPYWLHSVKYAENETDRDDSGSWYKLSEAVASSRKVIMEYYVASRDEVTKRRVDPLGLVYYTDHWDLIAHDHLRDEVRTFRLDRIRELYVLTEKFERPAGFVLSEHLANIGAGGEVHDIVLQFKKSTFSRARRSIPARIRTEIEKKGTVTVEFQFSYLPYLATWLLQFGADVRVREPKALRDAHLSGARAITTVYDS